MKGVLQALVILAAILAAGLGAALFEGCTPTAKVGSSEGGGAGSVTTGPGVWQWPNFLSSWFNGVTIIWNDPVSMGDAATLGAAGLIGRNIYKRRKAAKERST